MLENCRILVMILYNEFEPLQWFQDFFKIGWENENENENVTTNKILGSLEILAIKNEKTEIELCGNWICIVYSKPFSLQY